ncbi:hypothetical protein DDZ18_00460 [Marinicauda salina]|uniref:Kynureninase n=1 Tax=Marinicauda salina TaxID=2135793 RepID=A0A2U2BVT3_9PROT|nr:aminotransferase class V-fold PLP-dependent enzyme [Marinicauda salina]PWE18123.1 hypothetical protein DDZ18_00460 [Marinicauda salina]
MTTAPTRDDAERLDRADPLADRRALFDLPEGVIYLDGNSLGPPPKAALSALDRAAREEWGRDLIKSWNTADWIGLSHRTGDRIARLIGVPEGSVLCADSVSVNLFKLAAALVNAGAKGVAVETGDFPTDGYILEGLARLSTAGFSRIEPGAGVAGLPEGTGVLVKSAVHYRTAEIADIAAEEAAAKAAGASIIWDLSHAAGLVDLKLAADGARYAVGCGYKFLNGGPGAPAFVYCHPDEADRLQQPLSGWMGHARPFDFAEGYEAASGIARFGAGTPPVLSMTALHAALDAYADIDMAEVEAKARALGDLFLDRLAPLGLESVSPGAGARRGGHVSLRHPEGYAIVQALIARGVIGDFRSPDIMRFGFSPLYLSHADVFDAAEQMVDVIETRAFEDPAFRTRAAVT